MPGWPYLIHDFVVREDLCNIRCAYCWLATENVPMMRASAGVVGLEGEHGLTAEEPAAQVAERIRQQVQLIRQRCTYPILKLSGGELTVVKEWVDLIFEFADQFSRIQLLTNGTTLGRDLVARLCAAKNVVVQISLDGITAEANRHRGLGESQVAKILSSIDDLIQGGVGVELNTVVTSANASSLRDFVTWGESLVGGRKGRLLIQPRPVRGKGAETTQVDSGEAGALAEYLDTASSVVLPPPPYLRRVARVLVDGARTWPCYVPFFVLGTNDGGTIATCTCGHHLGVAGTVADSAMVLSRGSDFEPHRGQTDCGGCITQYEILNLFFEGELSESDLSCVPSLAGNELLAGLRSTRAAIESTHAPTDDRGKVHRLPLLP